VNSGEGLYEKILEGTMNLNTYTVESGDSLYSIAEKNGVTMDQIEDWNPGFAFPMIHIGDELVMQEQTSLLNVRTEEAAEYEEEIPFEIVYQDTDSMYEGEEVVLVEGVTGSKTVQGNIVKVNGVEKERIEISSVITAEPSTQTVQRGTKPVPPRIGTGTFIRPVPGVVTSTFRWRWGRMHEGVDFYASIGTPVVASDGGQVIFAGYHNGGFGYMVKIDHGGGMVTQYAHLSKILVSEGDMIYQGQHIANSGNTGYSTGPHLHFGVFKFGVAVNPLEYV